MFTCALELVAPGPRAGGDGNHCWRWSQSQPWRCICSSCTAALHCGHLNSVWRLVLALRILQVVIGIVRQNLEENRNLWRSWQEHCWGQACRISFFFLSSWSNESGRGRSVGEFSAAAFDEHCRRGGEGPCMLKGSTAQQAGWAAGTEKASVSEWTALPLRLLCIALTSLAAESPVKSRIKINHGGAVKSHAFKPAACARS